MRRRSSTAIWLLLVLVGCGDGHAQDSTEEQDPSSGPAILREDGTIALSAGAQAFVRVESVAVGSDVGVLRVPARVAYGDGSVAEVGVPAGGRIVEVNVRVGDAVEVGDPLFVLRSPDAAAARAELAEAHAELDGARIEAARAQQMLATGVGTDREAREAALRVAQIEIQLARARTQAALVGPGHRGDVTVRAPISGTVVARRAAIGMSVEPSDASLVDIGNPHALGITADVFDRDAAAIRVGAAVEVVLASSPDPLHGTVVYVGPTVTSGVRTVPVRIEVEPAPTDLRAGLFGRASITLVDQGVVVPSQAVLVRDGARTIVYVELEPGHYAARDVDAVPTGDGRVHVLSGLEAGDRVVVEGALLIDGAADLLL